MTEPKNLHITRPIDELLAQADSLTSDTAKVAVLVGAIEHYWPEESFKTSAYAVRESAKLDGEDKVLALGEMLTTIQWGYGNGTYDEVTLSRRLHWENKGRGKQR
jgi:hypothetical protein